MKRVTILTSGWALALWAVHATVACSSSDDSAEDVAPLTGAGGTAALPAPAAPVTAAAGTANAAAPAAPATPGAAPSAGGSEGMPPIAPPAPAANTNNAASGAMAGAAGASMGAGGAPPVAPPAGDLCPDATPSPSDGVACTVTCTDPCGVKNLGSRVCTCTDGAFDCASCEFTVEHPLLTPPTEPLANCAASDDAQEDDESGCTDNERCQSIGRTPGAADGANRFCGCLGGSWDCDTKPASFGG